MQILKSHSVLSAVCFSLLAVGASCSDSKDTSEGEPDAGANTSADASPAGDPDADPGPALPACAGASEQYLAVSGTEVVDFFGPNISVILADDDIAVMYPAGETYGTGMWDFPDVSEWVVEFCVNWDEDISDCETRLVPLEGSLQLNMLEESEEAATTFSGRFVSAIFVDDAESPTCQAMVDLAFSDS